MEADKAENLDDRDLKATRFPLRSYVTGLVVFRLLNSVHWALVGGLGWGFGTAVGGMFEFPGAATLGGGVGLAFVLLSVLTLGLGERAEHIPVVLAGLGGAAVGSISLLLLNPPGSAVELAIGGAVGFFVGLCSSVMKQHFTTVGLGPAILIAVTGSALFAGIEFMLGGWIGSAVGGGLSLFSVAVLAECLSRQRAVLVDENQQPIREIPRRESCWRVVRQSWSPTDSLAWGWHGVIGGLLAYLWTSWASDHPDTSWMRKAFFLCGGLAVAVSVAIRLGLKLPEQSQPTSNAQ